MKSKIEIQHKDCGGTVEITDYGFYIGIRGRCKKCGVNGDI